PGTRCTPTVDGNRVYTVSRQGHFFCLDSASGKVVWSKDFTKDFGGQVPTWGFSGSPWIEKDWVLVETGGAGASVAAFNKASGQVGWKNGNDAAGYGSLVGYDNGGPRCLAQFAKEYIIARTIKAP